MKIARGRFIVVRADCPEDGGPWAVIDCVDGAILQFQTRAEARDVARFARRYVKAHGDVDLSAFPYDLDSPLVYSASTERPWGTLPARTSEVEEGL